MEKMESEERDRGKIEFNERWNVGVFEVMAFNGTVKQEFDYIDKMKFPTDYPPRYSKCLILPLPPNFDWTKIDALPNNKYKSRPNCILITEEISRWKRKGRKLWRGLTPFLGKPGYTSVKEARISGKIGERSKVWLSEEKFMEITKRNLYVDKFYANQIFNRGKNSSTV